MEPRIFTTEAGLRRARARLQQALAAYQAVVESNPEAAEAGDNSVWHDNFAFEENQRQMHQWARRVRDLRAQLARLELAPPPTAPALVCIGCVLEAEEASTSRILRYRIAGYDDGDATAGRLAYNSPLGSRLMGASVGETREVAVAGAVRELTIIAIQPAPEE